MTRGWDREVDVLAFGAGMGGLCAALFAAIEGLDVLLCEKTDMVGGTTATSAGTVWIPGARDGDDIETAARYLDAEIGNRGERTLRDAFLESGRAALEHLQSRSEVKFRPVVPHPDYHPDQPGWSGSGRAFAPLPFDGRKLGHDFALVRPPIAPFMVLGGLMLARDDIPHFLKPFRSTESFLRGARILLRHAADRLRFRRGARLVMGNALVARLLSSLRRTNAALALNARLVELVVEDGRVAGAVVEMEGQRRRIGTRRGVVLATGGFSHSHALRSELLGHPGAAPSLAFDGDSGDGLAAARAVGAGLGESHGAAFWMPTSILREQGRETLFPHIVLDRAKPGLIAVDAGGRRFVNEAASYHDFVQAMLRAGVDPAWLVCDRSFIRDYGIGLVHPGSADAGLRRFVAAGYLHLAPTLDALAARIGVDAGQLRAAVAQHNRAATAGVDDAFGKGGNALNRHNGDASNKPNPCLRPIAVAPFAAVAVRPAEFGTSLGLRTDRDARVLHADGSPIDGLYACGNDMNSIMAGAYPGPGVTLGPALVFAFRAVRHMTAGKPA